MRYSCEVHMFKIEDHKFKDYVFKQKIATEWINDVVYCDNNVFTCFENETIGRLYANDMDDDEDDYEMDGHYAEEAEEDIE